MDKFLNKILIVDGSYTLHRALHTPGLQELCSTSGVKSGGIYGALRILQSEMKKFPEYFPIVCFDRGLSKRRTDLYPAYKANRNRGITDSLIAIGKTPEDVYYEEYRNQRSDLIGVLKSVGIPSLMIYGYEGDDLMYLLSTYSEESVILSDDKDMLQLVSPTCRVRRSLKNELITWEESGEYYHNPRFIIRKSIVGDESDNIPKVAQGVGEKTADALSECIAKYSFENMKEGLRQESQNLKPRLKESAEKVINNWDQFEVNYNLMNLQLVEVPLEFDDLIKKLILGTLGKTNLFNAYNLLGKYELNTIFPDQLIALTAMSSTQVLKKGYV